MDRNEEKVEVCASSSETSHLAVRALLPAYIPLPSSPQPFSMLGFPLLA